MAGRKRGHGEGTVYRRKDGRWIGKLMVGRKTTGVPDRRVVSGTTEREVITKLLVLRQQVQQGILGNGEAAAEMVAGFLRRWLEATRATVRPGTWQRYQEIVELHLVPALGHLRLASLRADDLQRLYGAKLADGLSARTVRYVHAAIRRALSQGMKWGAVVRNVADGATPPALARREIRALTPEEVTRLLTAGQGARLNALWTLAVFTGGREGELLGLKWDDVNLAAGSITIRRTLTKVANLVPTFGEPKTPRLRRTIPLAATALAALKAHKVRQLEERVRYGRYYADYDLVFATHLGTPLRARNVIRAFKALLEEAELPLTTRVHDLRHTCATLLLANGQDVPTTSAILGHAGASMTLDVYGHVLPASAAEAAQRLERAISG